MTIQWEDVNGIDWTMPNAPPLVLPPLSLLTEARVLINLEGLVARRQAAVERAASAVEQAEADLQDLRDNQADNVQDAELDLRNLRAQWDATIESLDTALKEQQQWERGFQWLPELPRGAVAGYTLDEGTPVTDGALKAAGNNQTPWGWYDPFLLYALDARSAFGYPNESLETRSARATRGLIAHESFGCEREFWGGMLVPTNFHLSASPNSPQSSPHRTLAFPFPNPTAVPGTVLGDKISLSDSLAGLDQAIANSDAGTGMIHATPYVVQKWTQVYPYMQDKRTNNIITVNGNVIIPGYGYPGVGPDQASRTAADVVTTDGSADVTSAADAQFSSLDIGQPIEGDGIPSGTVILDVASATAATMSAPATASATITATLPGMGGDATGSEFQWAYATDTVYQHKGDVHVYPASLLEMSPGLPVDNEIEVRAERTHALFTNYLLRAAVLVDTTTI